MKRKLPRSARIDRIGRDVHLAKPVRSPEIIYVHKNGRHVHLTVDWFDAGAIRWFITDQNGVEFHHGCVKNDNPDRAIVIARERAFNMISVGIVS